jgi:hypothetical protein
VIQDKDLRSFLDGIYVQDARLEFADWDFYLKLSLIYQLTHLILRPNNITSLPS